MSSLVLGTSVAFTYLRELIASGLQWLVEVVDVDPSSTRRKLKMAIRDNSQKVGFVYTNIYQLYKKAKQAEPQAPSNARVFRADEIEGIKVTKFEPRVFSKPAVNPETTQSAPAAREVKGTNPFDDLKANLDRLTDLHSKLRFMLNELDDLVKKK